MAEHYYEQLNLFIQVMLFTITPIPFEMLLAMYIFWTSHYSLYNQYAFYTEYFVVSYFVDVMYAPLLLMMRFPKYITWVSCLTFRLFSIW